MIDFNTKAEVTRFGIGDMQVCVPSDWNDERVEQFADIENPSGINGWTIRTDPEWLAGCPVRNPCSDRDEFVHIMLDC